MKRLLISLLLAAAPAAPATAQAFRQRLPQDEVIYFVLPDRFENGDRTNDRGGLTGDRLSHGFDPTHKGFYHGGDLNGLIKRLDYVQKLGVTAIWFAPVFKNKPVQGGPGTYSAGYHGYWVTDFTQVDPHFGSNAEFKAFVDAAHARGMKVYMDVITNHTADVIQFAECQGRSSCPYRSIADYPYQRRGGVRGPAINPGFAGEEVRTDENFLRLTNPNYAYTVIVPSAECSVKVPAWLNDPSFYRNRGDSHWTGESVTRGDFVGLDDVMTDDPRVVRGFIDIFGSWIDRFGIDGFRIDTARHVNPEFWQAFVPAMLERAKARGIPNFHIFGEVADDDLQPGRLAIHTRRDRFPAVLDFAFKQAVLRSVAGNEPTEIWRNFFAQDVLYEGGQQAAVQLPTFLGNHDQGRFGFFVRRAFPNASDAEHLARIKLANVILFTARGVPTIYYGDEQGFAGDGGDQDAREDMFPSQTAVYNDNRLIGSTATTVESNFKRSAPLYGFTARLAELRKRTLALRRGATLLRAVEDKPGLLAFSRVHEGGEVLVAVNTSALALDRNVIVEVGSARFDTLLGNCAVAATAPGSVRIQLPPFGYAVCAARNPR